MYLNGLRNFDYRNLNRSDMKNRIRLEVGLAILFIIGQVNFAAAQCAVCTKTAQQLGEGPAKGLNAGILYLAAIPLALAGVIGFRWYKREQKISQASK
jgi:hypothetical protein